MHAPTQIILKYINLKGLIHSFILTFDFLRGKWLEPSVGVNLASIMPCTFRRPRLGVPTIVFAQDLHKERAAQDPGNCARLVPGCRATRTLAPRNRCRRRALHWQTTLGLAFRGPATPGRGLRTGRAETARATTTTTERSPHIPRAATNSQVRRRPPKPYQ